MDELVRQALEILRGIWQRRWLGLGVAWLAAIVGAVVLFKMPEKYEASARVYVDTQSLLRPLMSGLAVQPDVGQEVSILSRTLISRPNVEKLMRMTDMDLRVSSPRQRDAMVDDLIDAIKISRAREQTNLYTLTYRDTRPDQAKKVVQSLLSIFVESSLGDKRQDTAQARRFIEDQIRTYEQRLNEAENRLKEFRLKHLALMGPEGRDYFGRMTQVAEQLKQARLDLRAAEQSRDALKKELAGQKDTLPAQTDQYASVVGVVPELDARIDAMKKNLDDLLLRYTDQHPDVVGTRRLMAELEQQRKEEVEKRRKAALANPAADVPNPMVQSFKMAQAEAEANVASIRAKVTEYESEYKKLEAAQRMVPQMEAELAQLNRDYDVQKRNYEQLVARRESATMASQMEAAGTADFRVIDPPRVSPKPVEPNRLLLLPLVLLIAIGIGMAASFAWSQIRPTFHTGRALRSLGNRPVLGAVSLVPNPKLIAKRRKMQFAFYGSLATLVACYGAGIALLLLAGRTV